MEKYISSTPNSLILGIALRAVLESINLEEFYPLVAENGLDHVKDDEWYPTQKVLTMYKTISQLPNGSEHLVSIGVKVYQTALLPSEINSVIAALQTLNMVMELNMKNVPDERYVIESVADRHLQVIDHTAFPHDLIYGFLWGIGRRFSPQGTSPIVKRTYINPTDPDKDGAYYDIMW